VLAKAFLQNDLIDVLPAQRILYIANPKVASSRIRATLAALTGKDTISNWSGNENWRVHKRGASGLRAPRHDVVAFYEVATDPEVLRFSFVRNPYDRLVSCWADQYRGKPLVPDDGYIGNYLKYRTEVDASLPHGASQTLSFAQFVVFATATADKRIERHWQLQSDILDVPGVSLNLIGRIENFAADFQRVLDFVKTKGDRDGLSAPFHLSTRKLVTDYYDAALAERAYRAYERDFDAYHYPRALSS
jgi:hypothetical protein